MSAIAPGATRGTFGWRTAETTRRKPLGIDERIAPWGAVHPVSGATSPLTTDHAAVCGRPARGRERL